MNTLVTFEETLSSMVSIFYWVSLMEITLWAVGLLVFFFHPVQMAIIWLYLLHIPKGALGLFMVIKFAPTSYDMIDSISEFPDTDVHLSFQEIGDHINKSFKTKMVQML